MCPGPAGTVSGVYLHLKPPAAVGVWCFTNKLQQQPCSQALTVLCVVHVVSATTQLAILGVARSPHLQAMCTAAAAAAACQHQQSGSASHVGQPVLPPH
jgi:hypothetical protein